MVSLDYGKELSREGAMNLRIDIWSDYVCPFCYIGSTRLMKALEETGLKESAEITYRSFQLDPDAKKGESGPYYRSLAEKYGISDDEAKDKIRQVAMMASRDGLHFTEELFHVSTFDAHRLGHLAKEKGSGARFTEAMYRSYFVDGLDISSKEVLLRIAEEAGIPYDEANAVLEGSDYSSEVKKDQKDAGDYGITGVPFFVIDGKYAISGAQSPESFRKALEGARD
jgi:predicted DsbA family dithiol-disulfide isomerase